MRIRLQLLANQNWRSNGCYQSLGVCARLWVREWTNVRVRISNKNNGGFEHFEARMNSKIWRAVFLNCAPVSLWGTTDSCKASFYLLIHVKITYVVPRGVQRNCIFWMLTPRTNIGVVTLMI